MLFGEIQAGARVRIGVGPAARPEHRHRAGVLRLDGDLGEPGVVAAPEVIIQRRVVAGVAENDRPQLTVGALEGHFWRNLCEQLGVPEFVADQFSEGDRRSEMFRVIREKFKQKTQAEWLAQLDRVLTDQQIAAIVAFLNTLTGAYRGQMVRPATATPRAGSALP